MVIKWDNVGVIRFVYYSHASAVILQQMYVDLIIISNYFFCLNQDFQDCWYFQDMWCVSRGCPDPKGRCYDLVALL